MTPLRTTRSLKTRSSSPAPGPSQHHATLEARWIAERPGLRAGPCCLGPRESQTPKGPRLPGGSVPRLAHPCSGPTANLPTRSKAFEGSCSPCCHASWWLEGPCGLPLSEAQGCTGAGRAPVSPVRIPHPPRQERAPQAWAGLWCLRLSRLGPFRRWLGPGIGWLEAARGSSAPPNAPPPQCSRAIPAPRHTPLLAFGLKESMAGPGDPFPTGLQMRG